MRAVGLLLLLLALCGSGAQGELQETETTKTTTPDIWAEVRALTDMVVELNLHVDLLQGENSDLQTRLSSSESQLLISKTKIETLERENAVQAADLMSLEAGLTATVNRTSDLETENAVQAADLMSLETRLTATESKTSDLETENAERKVAFYAALTDGGYVGPFDSLITLKYSKVFTNVGDAYNPSTGFFTAPVRGVYYLQFTACGVRPGHMGVSVYKNDRRIMFNYEVKEEGGTEYLTNSVVLELMAGDEIHLELPEGYSLYDSTSNYNTFSGSLLFTL
ncbi:heavy metal-binding protein HIP-like [Centropristis striata]|uniref:heavy metal-binding protein HIP-like n=1 Tax=Centropristis striata TaxID=184440 RepID=UPI0027E0CE5E|nr:heavy metal-binding protein HIP-like [Centropristis striata]